MRPSSWGSRRAERRSPGRGWPARAWALALLPLLAFGACGDSDPTGVATPDPDVEPFVGNWTASQFTVTSIADPDISLEVTEIGSFTLNVQPSGFYTATLHISGSQPLPENGQLSVVGNSIRLDPQGGPAVTASYAFQGSGRLRLEGPTEFDFGFNQQPQAATAVIVLDRS